MTDIDRDGWSGEGDFTQQLLDWLTACPAVTFVKVEDAPSTRSEVEYNFISNEVFVQFQTRDRVEHARRWGILPVRRVVAEKLMTIAGLESALVADEAFPSPDYADDGMIQFLHTQRIVPPYQTRGYKLVELVRVYEVGTPRRE